MSTERPGWHRPARILVVDDDPASGRAVVRLLGGDDEVRFEQDPAAALAVLEQAPGAVDLVLCDVAMPGMSGLEFLGWAQAISAELGQRVGFVTGAMRPALASFVAGTRRLVVEKPVEAVSLRRRVSEELARLGPAGDPGPAAFADDAGPALSSREAALRLGVSVATVKRWADLGLLPSSRTGGGHRRFPRAGVDAFGAAERARPAARRSLSWADDLLSEDGQVAMEAHLARAHREAGSWWEVWRAFSLTAAELHLRREFGLIDAVAWGAAAERVHRAVARFSPPRPPPGAPVALLAALPGSRTGAGLAMMELCLREAGWRTRWAGILTFAVLDDALRGGVADVAVVHSATGIEPESLRRSADRIAACAARGAPPIAIFGYGGWPGGVSGVERFHVAPELAGWLERQRTHLASEPGPSRSGPMSG